MIEVSGVTEAIARFVALEGAVGVKAEDAARAGAEPVLAAALEHVPVGETGRLKDSLRIETSTDKGIGIADVLAGGGDVDYAVYVEFAPVEEPFMRPAADEAKGAAEGAVGDVIGGVL